MKVAEGTTLVFETGEWSNYTFTGPFRVLKTFDQAGILDDYTKAWRVHHPEPEDYAPPTGDGFIAWMAAQGYIEDVPNVVSWHLGDHDDLEPEIQAEPERPATAA